METIQMTNQRLNWGEMAAMKMFGKSKGKDNSFVATAVVDKDIYFTPEQIAHIQIAQQQAREGKGTLVKGRDELLRYLDSL
jgi:hypothetical protein